MGGLFSSSSDTNSTSTTTPPPQVFGAGQQALGQAQKLGNAPFQIPAQPIANFTPQQLQAFQNINNIQGMAQPYYNAAASFETPMGAGQYFAPEAAGVMANLRDLDAQQMAAATGNLTQAAGGVGADRIAVAQAELARQQNLAAGNTLSQLYGNAVSQAQQAGVNLGQLGTGASQNALQEAAAQMGAGTAQQQMAQQQLNAQYKNILQQLAWPYQTTQFLGQLEAGVAPSMGGTTTGQSTTTSNPSLFQDLGNIFSLFNRGGDVEGYDMGGSISPTSSFSSSGPSSDQINQLVSLVKSWYPQQGSQGSQTSSAPGNIGTIPQGGANVAAGSSPGSTQTSLTTPAQTNAIGGAFNIGTGFGASSKIPMGQAYDNVTSGFSAAFGANRGGHIDFTKGKDGSYGYDSGGVTQSNPNPYAVPAALAAYTSPGAGSSGATLPEAEISSTVPAGLQQQLSQLMAERAALFNPLAPPPPTPSSNGKGSMVGMGMMGGTPQGSLFSVSGFDSGGSVPGLDDNEAVENIFQGNIPGMSGVVPHMNPFGTGSGRQFPQLPKAGQPAPTSGQLPQGVKKGFHDIENFGSRAASNAMDPTGDQINLGTGDLTDASGDIIPGARGGRISKGGGVNPFDAGMGFDDGGDVPDPAPVDFSLDTPGGDPGPYTMMRPLRRVNAPDMPSVNIGSTPPIVFPPAADLNAGTASPMAVQVSSDIPKPASPVAAPAPEATMPLAPISGSTPTIDSDAFSPVPGMIIKPEPQTPKTWEVPEGNKGPWRLGSVPVPMDAAKYAIGSFESGNNYGNITDSRTKLGRALGRYQVMEGELQRQLKESGLPPMTPEQFLKNKAAQDKLFETVFGGYMKKYGNFNDAASMWFRGKPVSQAGNARDVLGTTVPKYLDKTNAFLAKYSNQKGEVTTPATLPPATAGGIRASYEPKSDTATPSSPAPGASAPQGTAAYQAGKSLIGGPLGMANDFLEGTGIGQGKSALSRLGRAMLNPFAEPNYQLTSAKAQIAQMEVDALRGALGPSADPKAAASTLMDHAQTVKDHVADASTPGAATSTTPSAATSEAPIPVGAPRTTPVPPAPSTEQPVGSPVPPELLALHNQADALRRQAQAQRDSVSKFTQGATGLFLGARAQPAMQQAAALDARAAALESRVQAAIGPGNFIQNGRVVPVAAPLEVEKERQKKAATEGETPIEVPGFGSVPRHTYDEALKKNPDNVVEALREHFGTAKPQVQGEPAQKAPAEQPYPAGPRMSGVKPKASDYHPYTYDKEGVELEKVATEDLGKKLATKMDDGQNGLRELKLLQADAARLGDKGFLQTGAGDKARADFAKKYNSFNSLYLGGTLPDIDKTQIASAEDAQKITNRAGFLLSRSLGAREAAVVTQTAIASVPGIENTSQGNALINASLTEDIQYNKDKYEAFQQWRHLPGNKGWDTHDFEAWFAQSHPPDMYVARAQLKAGMPVLVDSPKTAANLPAGSKVVTPDGSIGTVPSTSSSDWSGFNLKPVDANDVAGAYWSARIGYGLYNGAGWFKGLVTKLGGMLGGIAGEAAGVGLGVYGGEKAAAKAGAAASGQNPMGFVHFNRGGKVKPTSDAQRRALRYAQTLR